MKKLFEMVIDRCLLCGRNKSVETSSFWILYPDKKLETGSICKDCFEANKTSQGVPRKVVYY